MRLFPGHPSAIYNNLGRMSEPQCHLRVTRLEMLAAQHVLPIWQGVLPHDQLPRRLLDTAETLVHGRADVETSLTMYGRP